MIVHEGDYRSWVFDEPRSAVSVGVYDGVHRGHQAVIEALGDGGDPVVVVTFARHPATIVAPSAAPLLLTSVEHRIELLAGYGADHVALLDFDDRMRRLAPEVFVEDVLVDVFRARRVAVGSGFRFGFGLRGDVPLLKSEGERHDFVVSDVPILVDGEPVRSTAIRQALGSGNVERAATLLGRPFQLRAFVVEGDHRGRELGFPTANLEIAAMLARPKRGVYAAMAGEQAVNRPAVVNVGVRPTVDGSRELVEVHLLDGDADLCGSELWVDFVARIRDERRFPSLAALTAQITDDAEQARSLLVGTGPAQRQG
ncbi:MAG: bifunctional riboflavin kinase/FAD synthetase [Acidimicrobiia bacterium]